MYNFKFYLVLSLVILVYGCSDDSNKLTASLSDSGIETQKKWEQYEKDYIYLECTPTNSGSDLPVNEDLNWSINLRILKHDSMVNPFKQDELSSSKKETNEISLTPYQKGYLASKKGKERDKLEKEFLQLNRIEAEKEAQNYQNKQEKDTLPTLFIDWHWGVASYNYKKFRYVESNYKEPQSCQVEYNDNQTKLNGWCAGQAHKGPKLDYIPARNNFLDSYAIDSKSSLSTYNKVANLHDSALKIAGVKVHSDGLRRFPADDRLDMHFEGSTPYPMLYPRISREDLSLSSFVYPDGVTPFTIRGICNEMPSEEYIVSVKNKYKGIENFLNLVKSEIIDKKNLEERAKEEREKEYKI